MRPISPQKGQGSSTEEFKARRFMVPALSLSAIARRRRCARRRAETEVHSDYASLATTRKGAARKARKTIGDAFLDARRIDVLSDSTGETAEKVVRAPMLQFPHSGAQIRLHTRVRTKEAARPGLERAAREGALVVFTVGRPELREYSHASSYEFKVEALDLIGSLIG